MEFECDDAARLAGAASNLDEAAIETGVSTAGAGS
jgi:hypothetical protein